MRKFEYGSNYIAIETLEGTMMADMGDYIIKGIKGEFYPCKSDIFEQTYDLVDDVESNERDCTTCKNAYIKDGVYLICDIDGIQNDVVKDCENYEGVE